MEIYSNQQTDSFPKLSNIVKIWLSDKSTPFILIIGLFVARLGLPSTITIDEQTFKTPFLNIKSVWADTLLKNMTIEEKIGQLLMIEAEINNSEINDSMQRMMAAIRPGGLIIKTDSIYKQVDLVNSFQSISEIPLLIGLNSQSGYPDYLMDLLSYSSNFSINAINDDSLINTFGEMIAKQCKFLGININFYPFFSMVGRIYPDYDSLYIEKVLKNALIISQKLQENNVLACLNDNNHFKGIQGDSLALSRYVLYPYKSLIDNGLSGVSINTTNSLSPVEDTGKFWLEKYIINDIKFQGLSISKLPKFGKPNVNLISQILNNGSDIIIVNNNVSEIISILKNMVETNVLTIDELDKKVRKILLAKSWTGLENYKPLKTETTLKNINSSANKLLSRQLIESSITLVKNELNVVPFKELSRINLYVYTIGNEKMQTLRKYINYYSSFSSKHLYPEGSHLKQIGNLQKSFNTVIIALDDIEFDSVQLATLEVSIKKLQSSSNVILINLGDPKMLSGLIHCKTIIQAFDNSTIAQELTAQLVFGGVAARGVLPYTVNDSLRFNLGINTKTIRLKYTIPEEVGISSSKLLKIDSIIWDGIGRRATPGCQVFIAKEGKVIYNKSFGYHTYSRSRKVMWDDLYDIASVTKVIGTTLAVMRMYDEDSIKLNSMLGEYFKNTTIDYSNIKADTFLNIDTLYLEDIKDIDKILKVQDTIHLNDSMIVAYDSLIIKLTPKLNIFKLKVKDLLIHKSGLSPSMPILPFVKFDKEKVLQDSNLQDTNLSVSQLYKIWLDKYYCSSRSDSCNIQIADGFYLKSNYMDSLWEWTKQMRVYSRKIYQYSDANMVLLQMTIDSINETGIDKFLDKNYYKPLGLRYTCYKPLSKFDRTQIIPTEVDDYWRRQLVHGHVHDPTAALLGGVAGNAGIFSNANDLGILLQMLLNGGVYGGKRYLSAKTVNLFTSRQEDSHRGLGFDIPGRKSICAKDVSNYTFGHTGFTGICVWVDKKEELIFVFLSNRVHPSVDNWRLNTLKIRNRVHQVVYDCIKEGLE